jgi:flagellar biosynthesis/type III secretory pathway protein FliH
VNAVETYLELDDAEEAALQSRLDAEAEETMEATELTWADKMMLRGREQGIEQGIERGIEQGELNARRQIARRQLQRRFNDVPAAVEARIEAADEQTLDTLLDRIVTAGSLEDLLAGI